MAGQQRRVVAPPEKLHYKSQKKVFHGTGKFGTPTLLLSKTVYHITKKGWVSLSVRKRKMRWLTPVRN